MKRRRLDGARCLITGSSSGIGQATARRLVSQGAKVCLHGRDEERLALTSELTGGAPWIAADLSDDDAAEHVVTRAASLLAGLDILIHSAGHGNAGPFAESDPAAVQTMLTLNISAAVDVTRHALPVLAAGHTGAIVLLGSIAGCVPVRGEVAYSASKWAIHGFGQALRTELRSSDITVTVVHPGLVATPFFDARAAPNLRRFPRPVTAERVATAITDGICRGTSEVFVPAWLRLPARLHGAAPGFYDLLAALVNE